ARTPCTSAVSIVPLFLGALIAKAQSLVSGAFCLGAPATRMPGPVLRGLLQGLFTRRRRFVGLDLAGHGAHHHFVHLRPPPPALVESDGILPFALLILQRSVPVQAGMGILLEGDLPRLGRGDARLGPRSRADRKRTRS